MATNLRFYFMGTNLYDGYLKRQAALLDNETAITGVTDMVRFVLRRVKSTDGGRIKTIVFASHGSRQHFYIGNDVIDLYSIVEYKPQLIMLAPFFQSDAKVFVSACNTGESSMLYSLAKLWRVEVIGWDELIVVKEGWFGDYMEYPRERIVHKMGRPRKRERRVNLGNLPFGYDD